MGLKTLGDDGGQSNIDFMFGVGVFLVTFLYVATFIPGIFIPYQPGAIDLSSVVYRTSAILAEDPGWFSHDNVNGTAWEENINDLSRVGLADDKDHPDVLSMDKINALNGILANKSNYASVRDNMGLYGTVEYDVDVSVKLTDTGNELINTSTWPSASDYNVESIERIVMVDKGKQMFVDCNKDPNPSNKSAYFIANFNNASTVPFTKNITIRIFNTTGVNTINPGATDHVRWSRDGLTYIDLGTYGVDYFFYKNGIYSLTEQITINSTDIVELVIVPSAIQYDGMGNLLTKYIMVIGSGNMFPSSALGGKSYNYFNDPVCPQKSVYYPGIMRLEVWSDALA